MLLTFSISLCSLCYPIKNEDGGEESPNITPTKKMVINVDDLESNNEVIMCSVPLFKLENFCSSKIVHKNCSNDFSILKLVNLLVNQVWFVFASCYQSVDVLNMNISRDR